MGPITIVFGVLLTLVGLYGYFASEVRSVTALIPAFVGGAFILLGALALRDAWRKHAMHAAAALGLLGFLAALGRLVAGVISKGEFQASLATLTLTAMLVLCGVFVGLCVKSFRDARRARGNAEAGGGS